MAAAGPINSFSATLAVLDTTTLYIEHCSSGATLVASGLRPSTAARKQGQGLRLGERMGAAEGGIFSLRIIL